MKRRSFLKSGSVISLPILLNGLPVSAIAKSSIFNAFNSDNDKVLVLLQLDGGNDGLNTIIPLDQYDNLANARGNILIPESSVLKLDDTVGFHPSMQGLKSVWDEGRMAVLQSVGYPNQNRSHFRSTDIWTMASPADEFWQTGWLGRYFERDHPEFPEDYPNSNFPDPFALTIGSSVSETCQGTVTNFSMAINDPFSLNPLAEGGEDDVPNTPYGFELTFLRTAIAQTNAYADVITAAANNGSSLSTLYNDDNRLAQQLKTVATLVSGGLQTKVYIVRLGGFDTHANQVVDGDTVTGGHADLLQTISGAVEAFMDDVKLLGLEERVVGMTFSEFGRRIRSNDSLGTDHGTAAPLMIFGNCVNPGIYGDNPEIPQQPEVQEGVPMQYDFRSIYGSILMDWFGVSEGDVKSLIYDGFTYIPVLNPCSTTSIKDFVLEDIESRAYPNPCNGYCTIAFKSKGDWARISVFDVLGHEVKVISDKSFTAGEHHVKFETRGLAPGNYYYRILTKYGQKTKALVKQ